MNRPGVVILMLLAVVYAPPIVAAGLLWSDTAWAILSFILYWTGLMVVILLGVRLDERCEARRLRYAEGAGRE